MTRRIPNAFLSLIPSEVDLASVSKYEKLFKQDASYCLLVTQNLNLLLQKSSFGIRLPSNITIMKSSDSDNIEIKLPQQLSIVIAPQPDPDVPFCLLSIQDQPWPTNCNTYRVIFTFLFKILRGQSIFNAIYNAMTQSSQGKSYSEVPIDPKDVCKLKTMIQMGVRPPQIKGMLTNAEKIARYADRHQDAYLHEFASLFGSERSILRMGLFPPRRVYSSNVQHYLKSPDRSAIKTAISNDAIIQKIQTETLSINQMVDAIRDDIFKNGILRPTWSIWFSSFFPDWSSDKDLAALSSAVEIMKEENSILQSLGEALGLLTLQHANEILIWAKDAIQNARKGLQGGSYHSSSQAPKQRHPSAVSNDDKHAKIQSLKKIIQFYSKKGNFQRIGQQFRSLNKQLPNPKSKVTFYLGILIAFL